MRNGLISSIVVLAASTGLLASENWPEFRGPSQQGHSDAVGLPTHWSTSRHVKFHTAIPGVGWSSPVIWASQVWMTTATEEGHSLRAICADRDSGKILHDVEVFHVETLQRKNSFNSFASPTPVIEAGRVYVCFGTYGSACLDTETGKVVWKNEELKIDHYQGPGSSPVLFRDFYLLDCDGIDVQYLAALDKKTGKLAWKTPRSFDFSKNDPDERKAYCTPTLIEENGKPLLVDVGSHRAYGYDPTDGRELWHVDIPGWSAVPRPVVAGKLAFVCTGYNTPEVWAVRLGGSGDLGATGVAWKSLPGAPKKPSLLVVDDLLYVLSDLGVMRCLDPKTGKQVWQARVAGDCTASPIDAGGLIYVFDEQAKCIVLKAGRSAKIVGVNQLEGKVLASPAVSGKALFVRTDGELYRLED